MIITLSRGFTKKLYERKGDVIENKIVISKEQAKIIATAVTPYIKEYIETHRSEYEAWLKEQKTTKIIKSPLKNTAAEGA